MDGRRDMWAEAYLRGNFFAKMKANQRCESMNSYLKHFLQCRLKMFEFVRQIDQVVIRIRHVETFDDCNDSIGAPSVTTHLKKLEGYAAQVFTRRVFFMVREELKREINYIMRSAPEIHSDHYVYTLTKYQSEKSYSVKFWVANGHITCSCLGFETDGIPCRHAFAVMKHENLTEIPPSLILDRWKKNAKANVQCRRANSNNDEEGQTARYGSLYAAALRMLYLGSKYVKCYPTVLDQISKVTAMLKEIAIAEETTGTTEAPINPTIAEVFNPVVVRTKGCGTQRKERVSGTRRCKYCEEVGHNSRSCPTKKRDELNQTTSQRTRAETAMESQQYGQNFYPNGGTTPIGSETQSWSQYMPFESTVFNNGLGNNRVGPSLGFPFDDDY